MVLQSSVDRGRSGSGRSSTFIFHTNQMKTSRAVCCCRGLAEWKTTKPRPPRLPRAVWLHPLLPGQPGLQPDVTCSRACLSPVYLHSPAAETTTAAASCKPRSFIWEAVQEEFRLFNSFTLRRFLVLCSSPVSSGRTASRFPERESQLKLRQEGTLRHTIGFYFERIKFKG